MEKLSAAEIAALRRNYSQQSLSKATMYPDPVAQFERWFNEAIRSEIPEPNAMTLASASRDGKPSARIVLLKGFDQDGFIFYTNYNSRKGHELDENPHAAMLFCWLELERQIRIEGKVERIEASESKIYFQSRPRESQIGAWASPQSHVIENRSVLEDAVHDLANKHKHEPVLPLPPFWGGYRLIPKEIEFWQGRENRLHDRIRYTRSGSGWGIDRLAP